MSHYKDVPNDRSDAELIETLRQAGNWHCDRAAKRMKSLKDESATLRQRIEALEGALRRIEQLSPDVTHGWAVQARNIARQALGEGT